MSDDNALVIDDMSSAERQSITKKIRRKNTGVFSHRRESTTQPTPHDSLSYKALHTTPELHTFAELVKDNTHIDIEATEKQCSLIGQKRLLPPSSTNTQTQTQHVDALSEIELAAKQRTAFLSKPWDYLMLSNRLQSLPKPVYYPRDLTLTMSTEQMEEAMRRRQLQLPLMPAEHEQELLQESGLFKVGDMTYDFPACIYGKDCVSVCYINLIPGFEQNTKGFTCTSVMFPDEYQDFIKDGKPPASKRPCILCCRKKICDHVVTLRLFRCVSDEKTASEQGTSFILSRQPVYQLYRNLVNQRGGYYDVYMLFPKSEEAIIDPIVLLNLSALKLETVNGRRRIDQRVMHWRPTIVPKPLIGERESHFC
jgi:ferredoxin